MKDIERFISRVMISKKCECTFCGCVDKYRWLWWVIQNKTKICDLNIQSDILYFAPERGVSSQIKKANHCIRYISGDIEACFLTLLYITITNVALQLLD